MTQTDVTSDDVAAALETGDAEEIVDRLGTDMAEDVLDRYQQVRPLVRLAKGVGLEKFVNVPTMTVEEMDELMMDLKEELLKRDRNG